MTWAIPHWTLRFLSTSLLKMSNQGMVDKENIFKQYICFHSRVVKFIVDGSVGSVSENQDSISDLLSTITGGVAEIQDIQAFSGQPGTLGTLNIDRIDRGEEEEGGREPRVQETDDKKSVVDVFIR